VLSSTSGSSSTTSTAPLPPLGSASMLVRRLTGGRSETGSQSTASVPAPGAESSVSAPPD